MRQISRLVAPPADMYLQAGKLPHHGVAYRDTGTGRDELVGARYAYLCSADQYWKSDSGSAATSSSSPQCRQVHTESDTLRTLPNPRVDPIVATDTSPFPIPVSGYRCRGPNIDSVLQARQSRGGLCFASLMRRYQGSPGLVRRQRLVENPPAAPSGGARDVRTSRASSPQRAAIPSSIRAPSRPLATPTLQSYPMSSVLPLICTAAHRSIQ